MRAGVKKNEKIREEEEVHTFSNTTTLFFLNWTTAQTNIELVPDF